jgi:hypothetical protein
MYYIIAVAIAIIIAIIEGVTDARIIKKAGNVSHVIRDRGAVLVLLSIMCTGLMYNENLLELWLQLIIVGVNLSAAYWIVFELSLNITMGWDIFYIGKTAKTDIVLRRLFGKATQIAVFVLKLSIFIGSTILL